MNEDAGTKTKNTINVKDKTTQKTSDSKKRINKKWAKRYGYTIYNSIEDEKVITMNGTMYMNLRTYYKIQGLVGKLV